MAPVEATTNLGRRFFEAQDRLRGGPDPDLCTSDYVARIAGNPPMPLAGHQGFSQAFYAAFPDLVHTVEETVSEGDRIAVRFKLCGTQRADFMGIPATGKPIEVGAVVILRTAGGRVAELQGEFDQLGMMRQLGVIA